MSMQIEYWMNRRKGQIGEIWNTHHAQGFTSFRLTPIRTNKKGSHAHHVNTWLHRVLDAMVLSGTVWPSALALSGSRFANKACLFAERPQFDMSNAILQAAPTFQESQMKCLGEPMFWAGKPLFLTKSFWTVGNVGSDSFGAQGSENSLKLITTEFCVLNFLKQWTLTACPADPFQCLITNK